jgi:hypothetical protein
VLSLLSVVACFAEDPDPGDTGATEPASAMPYCEEVDSVSLVGEDDALGLSAEAFLAALPAEAVAAADWADGSASGLTLALSVDADSLRRVSQEVVYPDTGGPVPEIAVECPTYVAVDASVVVSSDDGRLSEAFAASLQRDEYSGPDMVAAARVALDPDDIAGSLDLGDFVDTSAYDELGLDLDIVVADAAVSGSLAGLGSGEDGAVAFADFIDVMSFSGALD